MVKEAAIPPAGQSSSGKDGRQGLPSGNLVVKCPRCREILLVREWEKSLKVCSRCNFHFKLSAYERIDLLVDPDSFVETDADMVSVDPLKFVSRTKDDVQVYAKKLAEEREKVGLNEAVVSGYATIETLPLALAVMDFRFIGGSMGSVVGEKITRAIELGIEKGMAVLICSASGGARMQEGLYSLMQMAKASAALAKLGEAKLPFFSLLTDPTTGGVTASFAMLGDVTIAEPGALICFAGPRVIEQNMHMKLPEGAVTSEFVLQHGMIDAIVHRRDLRQTLARLLRLYTPDATLQTEPLLPTAIKVELDSLDRRGGSDGLRPGV
jgi:acetyl-CoA carboxylase carboxyl transferase subunit beta